MLSDFRVRLVQLQGPQEATPDRYQTHSEKCSEKMHEGNKKTSEKLAQTKNLHYLCIKQKNKRPGYPGDD